MPDYDNTNRAALFKPRGEKLILQGKINIDGEDHYALIVARKTQDGQVMRNVYVQAGPLYVNDKEGNENRPDYSGPILKGKRISLWKKTLDSGEAYMSGQVQDANRGGGGGESFDGPAEVPNFELDDDLPF